ncbi:MAG: HYR domain-containing protein [candidate division Zixibacteria bacterium]|nr:HYR domain-containing protein [candidate division Zixibacteria bacterium]
MMSLFAAIRKTVVSTAIIILLCFGIADAQSKTQKDNLERLSLSLGEQLEAKRPQLYYDLLNSADSAQIQLNRNSDIQLMYIDNRSLPVYYQIDNLDAAGTVSSDDIWPGGSGGYSLSGQGTSTGLLAVWDGGGVRATHQEFGSRVTQIDSPGGTHYHATHVAGTMMATGVQAQAKGMSYEANLAAYDWNNDNSEMASAAAAGLNVSNHSYSYITGWYWSGSSWYWYGDISISATEDYGFGFYSADAQAWDEIAYNAPYYTIVNSAGNDRNDAGPGSGGGHYVWDGGWVWSTATRDPDGGTDGYDCISYNSNAKNIITVGAVNDITGGYSVPGDVVMSSFSGWGPSDDGRIKPDIVANGINLYSTMDNNNSAYDYLSGTSMSAPNFSGSLNLLIRYYEESHVGITPRSSTMKALVIQTADESGSNPGPDYKFGWGLLNSLKSAQLIQNDSISPGMVLEDSLANMEIDEFYFTCDGITPIKITAAWTDPAGTPPSPSLNPTTIMLVNDLDIRLEHIGSSIVTMPYTLNPLVPDNPASTGDNIRDNVEQIYVGTPSSGQYKFTISHKGTLASPQYYSVVSSVNLSSSTGNNPPVALCIDITTDANASCQADISVDNGSYDPDGDSITLLQIPASPYSAGQTIVSLIVTDDSGLADTCQATVTVNDNTPPVATCPLDIMVDNDPGECGAIVTFSPGATDNCGVSSVTANPPSGSFFGIGTTPVEVIAINNTGTANTCYYNATVNEAETQIATCPLDITVDNDPGECGATVTFSPGATDNCGVNSVTANPPSGSFFGIGTTPVEVIAIDNSGNADTCYFNVTVNEGEAPVATCPSDIMVENDPGECGATVTFSPGATDNCGVNSVTTNPPSGSFLGIGTTPVEVIAIDNSGNADTCYFNVTVNEGEAPIIVCPDDIAVDNDPGLCGAVVTFELDATDNCSDVSIDVSVPSGSFFGPGSTMINVIATDVSGNTDSCYFFVSVYDNEPPIAICQEDTIVSNDPGQCGAIVSFEPGFNDNCSSVMMYINPPSGSYFDLGTTPVEVAIRDAFSNVDTCYFNVTVIDNEPPVTDYPADITVDNAPGQCEAVVNYSISATDNCALAGIVADPPSGSHFPVGSTQVTIYANDSSGNTDTSYFNVTVNDIEIPDPGCPANIEVANDPDQCGAIVSFTFDPSDNCSVVYINATPPSGSFFDMGTTPVEVITSDIAGNADTCFFNVNVIDIVPPDVTCPSDITVNNDPGECGAVVAFTADATDNCSSVTISSNPPSGSLFAVGVNPVEVIATDDYGNTDTCYFNVTVNDIELPVPGCPADIVASNDPGQCGATVTFALNPSDNCPDVNVAANPPSGSFFPIGLSQVEVIATDAAGNADTCDFSVSVNDTEPPVAICPADMTVEIDSSLTGAYVEFSPDAIENCPGVTIESDPASGSWFALDTTMVEVIATDDAGLADTCYFNIVIAYNIGSDYLPGDANMANGAWPPMVIGGDVTYLVNYFRGMETSPPCLLDSFWCSADANGDCSVIGSDVTKLVTYFRSMTSIQYCPDYAPAWPTPDDLPAEAPSGWPNCEE